MKLSLFLTESTDPDRAVEQIVGAEERGFYGVWSPQLMGLDALTVLAAAGMQTERILLGTSVVPTWPRHPVVMAQQALTVARMSHGRLRLGIGTSHVPVIRDMFGIDFDKPIRHVREYLGVLKPLAAEGSVSFAGEQYRVAMTIDIPDPSMPVMLSVLSEQMTRTAGRYADGAITWLAPPSYIASTVAPLLAAAAQESGRPAPPIVAQVPATVSSDPDAVRKIVRRLFAVYPMLPFYNTMMQKAGLPGAEEALTGGWTDELIDAVIPYGDDRALGERAQEYFDAGADEVVYAPFPTGGDWDASLNRTLDVMSAIARS